MYLQAVYLYMLFLQTFSYQKTNKLAPGVADSAAGFTHFINTCAYAPLAQGICERTLEASIILYYKEHPQHWWQPGTRSMSSHIDSCCCHPVAPLPPPCRAFVSAPRTRPSPSTTWGRWITRSTGGICARGRTLRAPAPLTRKLLIWRA